MRRPRMNLIDSCTLSLALALIGGIASGSAHAQYRAVVLPIAETDADLEARRVSHHGYVTGMIRPRSPEITPKPVLWWPSPDWPSGFGAQVYALAGAGGAPALASGGSLGIDTETNAMIGFVRSSGSSPRAFYQTGYDGPPSYPVNVILWQDLQPAAISASEARGAQSGVVVGAVLRNSAPGVQAALWNGNAYAVGPGHFVSLHSSVMHHTAAEATNGYVHVGGGGRNLQEDHALVWTGTSAGAVDLHPAGSYYASQAMGVDVYGNRLAGWAAVDEGAGAVYRHAWLWYQQPGGGYTDSAYTDIHPSGLDWSEARGVAPGAVVGVGNGRLTGNETRALYWPQGVPSALDLQQFLPANYVWSEAVAVSHDGMIVGNGLTADGYQHAVAWVPAADFWIVHDQPVLYTSAANLTVAAAGTVALAAPAASDRRIVVRSGGSAQTVVIPAGQSEGRFRLTLSFSRMTAGKFRLGFSGNLNGVVSTATLTLIRTGGGSLTPLAPAGR